MNELQLSTPERDEAWLANRSKGWGASEWLAALGFDASRSQYALVAEKLGRIRRDVPLTEDIEFGHLMEPVALLVLHRRTGREVTRWPQNQSVVSKTHPFLFATPDATQRDERLGLGVVESKNRNVYVAKQWAAGPPLVTQTQLQGQLFCMGLDYGTICVVIGGNRFRWFDVARDDDFIGACLPVLEDLWGYVERGELPPVDGSRATNLALKEVYAKSQGLTVALGESSANDFAELSAIKRAQKLLENRREAVENRIWAAMGSYEESVLPDGNAFSLRPQTTHRDCPKCGMELQHSEYRVLRQHYSMRPKPNDWRDAIAYATAELLAAGFTLRDESESGSRYFIGAGGLQIRLADHEPNGPTTDWIERRQVASIRVDCEDWQESLAAIVGQPDRDGSKRTE